MIVDMSPLPPFRHRPISSASSATPTRIPMPIHLLLGDKLVMKESSEVNRLSLGGWAAV